MLTEIKKRLVQPFSGEEPKELFLTRLTPPEQERLQQVLSSFEDIRDSLSNSIWVIGVGSIAKGNTHRLSDVDIAVYSFQKNAFPVENMVLSKLKGMGLLYARDRIKNVNYYTIHPTPDSKEKPMHLFFHPYYAAQALEKHRGSTSFQLNPWVELLLIRPNLKL